MTTKQEEHLKVPGVSISDPIVRLFSRDVRVLEWKGSRGETHLKVVPAEVTAGSVAHAVSRHVCGTQYIFVNARAPA